MTAPAIEVRGLTRRFKDVEALRGLDLTVEGLGVCGFLGVNGAGKTTTFRILTGLIRPDSGEAKILGAPVGPGNETVLRRVGYLPQQPAAYGWMTGEEFLRFVADLFAMGRTQGRERAGELLERCGLKEAAKRRVAGYSGGMKQRLGIAQALMNTPELLLLDEPVASLDPIGRAEVLDLVDELGESATVFMSSHILGDIERICRDVAIVDKGRVVVYENVESLKGRLIRPVFELTLGGEGKGFAEEAEKTEMIEEAERTGENGEETSFKVTAKDLEGGRREIPRLVGALGLSLVKFRSVTPTLEEVFMKMVAEKEEAR